MRERERKVEREVRRLIGEGHRPASACAGEVERDLAGGGSSPAALLPSSHLVSLVHAGRSSGERQMRVESAVEEGSSAGAAGAPRGGSRFSSTSSSLPSLLSSSFVSWMRASSGGCGWGSRLRKAHQLEPQEHLED